MAQIKGDADCRPRSKHALLGLAILIKSEDSDWRVIEAVHHAGSGSKVVQLLSDVKIPSVEDHAEGPTCKSEVTKAQIIGSKGVATRDFRAESFHSPAMSKEIEQREQH